MKPAVEKGGESEDIMGCQIGLDARGCGFGPLLAAGRQEQGPREVDEQCLLRGTVRHRF